MPGYIFVILLIMLGLMLLIMRKTYFYLPIKELKRRAKNGDPTSHNLYRAASYQSSLHLLLMPLAGLSLAGGIVQLAAIAPAWVAVVVTALLLWFTFSWLPNTKLSPPSISLTVAITPAVVWTLNYLHPFLSEFSKIAGKYYSAINHTGLYQRDDLIHLIEKQKEQSDSRMSTTELDMAARALTFSEQKVRDVLVPRKQVHKVGENDTVGPVLLDELHKTGYTSFPVSKGKPDNMVGVLYLKDIGLKTVGHVREFMKPQVYYAHEGDSLSEVLNAFYQTKHHMFVVVNSFEEYVGIVTVEDIIFRLLGSLPDHDFDEHTDKKAVASRHPKPSKNGKKDKKLPEPEETVIE